MYSQCLRHCGEVENKTRGFMKNGLVLITGPKHSGKSMAALALEKITGGEALDLDEIVERQTGKKVRELFREGSEIFREAEARALSSLIRLKVQDEKLRIIATGGGIIDNPEAMALLAGCREIVTVYLDVSPETAWVRILRSAAGSDTCTTATGELPPFLNTENPRETHLALHKRRAEAYKALASLTISAENKSPEEIAGEIAERLELPANL